MFKKKSLKHKKDLLTGQVSFKRLFKQSEITWLQQPEQRRQRPERLQQQRRPSSWTWR